MSWCSPTLTHPATEPAETPPNPTSMIPFNRDTRFVMRQTIFDQIDQIYMAQESWIALVGIGGVG